MTAYGLTAAGPGYAFVAAGSAGILGLDVHDPLSPTIGSQVRMAGSTRGVAAAGNRLYAVGADGTFAVYDVTRPAQPVELGELALPDGGWGVAVAGGFAYVGLLKNGVQVVDVGDPARPHRVTTALFEGVGVGERPSHAIAAVGERLYVVDQRVGIRVMDIREPARARVIGRLDVAVEGLDAGGPAGLLFISTGADLVWADAEPASAPRPVAIVQGPG
jgi:hypothetical protein